MIPIFRRIRKKMADDNKPIKYLRYAIGEIVLVVIGILIALQINNWNEQRKDQKQINSILNEIQSDLSVDIERANFLMEYYHKKDSLWFILQYKNPTYNDFKNNISGFSGILSNYEDFRIHDNGFKNLMQKSDHIPDSYKNLLPQLNAIYIEEKFTIDEYNDKITTLVLNYLKKLSEEVTWYGTFEPIDSVINYYYQNPFFKNEVSYYSMIARNFQLIRFKSDAINAYLDIAKITGTPEELPKYMKATIVDPEVLKEYSGKYKLKESDFPDASEYFFITIDGNKIFVGIDEEKRELFKNGDDTFLEQYFYSSIKFTRNNNAEVIGYTGKIFSEKTVRVKVE